MCGCLFYFWLLPWHNGSITDFYEIKQELLGHDSKTCPVEENVEAICQFFNTIGKQLDENPKSKRYNDAYFNRLKDLTANPQLAPRLRFMVRNVLDLRSNNWVPRREEVFFFFFSFSYL
jgi:translation initiation factor 4G